MNARVFWRKVHYWAAAVVALPLLVITVSGLLLQVKKDVAWVQPDELRGRGGESELSLPQILEACLLTSGSGVSSWDDIERVDFRPAKSLIKVTTQSNREIQIDAASGEVMQIAVRRSDLIESIHDGSILGLFTKRFVFLPSGIGLLLLWATGAYLFLLPLLTRRKRNKASN